MNESALPLHRQRPSWVTLVMPALFLIILTAAIYLPALHGPMIFDDMSTLTGPAGVVQQIMENPSRLLTNDRPLLSATFVLSYLFTGQDPAGYRAMNIALHILAGLVLLDLGRRTLASPRFNMRWVSLATPLATVIAGLWMVHPLQTQAVSYIVQRGEVLGTLFIFLSLDALAMAAGAGRWGKAIKAVAIAACMGAMLSKQIGYLTPVLLFLYDRSFWACGVKACFKERPVFYAAALLTWVIPWQLGLGHFLMADSGTTTGGFLSAGFGTQGIGPWDYFFTQQTILVHYLGLVFWPMTLVLDYRFALMEPAVFAGCPDAALPLSLGVMVTLGVLTLWAIWRRPAWGFLGGWFFLMMAPTSSFLTLADLAMEHRMYGASAGVIAAAVMGVTLMLQRISLHRQAWAAPLRLAGIVLFILVLFGLAVRTVNRNLDYASAVRLWAKVHADRPSNTRAMLILGRLIEPRQPQLTLELYRQAARLEPTNYEPMISLGSFYLTSDQPDEASKWYAMSYRLSGDQLTYLLNMGLVAQARSDLPGAAHFLSQAMRVSPDNVKIMTNLGMVLDQLATQRLLAGDGASAVELRGKAIAAQEKALTLDPASQAARVNLATALVNLGMEQMLAGQGTAAAATLTRSLAVQRRPGTARRLAWLLATWPQPLVKDWEPVIQMAQEAAKQVEGRQPLYLDTLAAALARAGRFEQAAATECHAIEIARSAGIKPTELEPLQARLGLYERGQAYMQTISVKP